MNIKFLSSLLVAFCPGRLVQTAAVAMAGALLMAVLMVSKPDRYTSSARFLPVSKAASNLGTLGSLSSMVGLPPGGNAMDAALPHLLHGRVIMEALLEKTYSFHYRTWKWGREREGRMTLEAFLAAPDRDTALERLTDLIEPIRDLRTGIVESRVTLPSRDLAQQVNSDLLDQLEGMLEIQRRSRGMNAAAFMNGQIKESRAELNAALDKLTAFAEQNRNYQVSPDPRTRATGLRLEMELELGKRQIAVLFQQSFGATLEERDSTPMIFLLDPPNRPLRKSGPPRGRNILITFVLTGVFWLVWGKRKLLLATEPPLP